MGQEIITNGIIKITVSRYKQIQIFVLVVLVGFPDAEAAGKTKMGNNKNMYRNKKHIHITVRIIASMIIPYNLFDLSFRYFFLITFLIPGFTNSTCSIITLRM